MRQLLFSSLMMHKEYTENRKIFLNSTVHLLSFTFTKNQTCMHDFEAFFKLSYGLYIVCSGKDEDKNGFISNSVFQVTSEPPQFAACCNKDNHTTPVIIEHGAFSISVLRQDTPKEIIGMFGYKSGSDVDKFKDIRFKTGITGVPVVLTDSVACIECKVVNTFDVGTHLIIIGEAVASEVIDPDEAVLTYEYYRNIKKVFAPKNAPTYIDRKKLMNKPKKATMEKYQCTVCGHIYDPAKGDPESGIPAGTAFEDLPNDWVCPECGAQKSEFEKLD